MNIIIRGRIDVKAQEGKKEFWKFSCIEIIDLDINEKKLLC